MSANNEIIVNWQLLNWSDEEIDEMYALIQQLTEEQKGSINSMIAFLKGENLSPEERMLEFRQLARSLVNN